jgi:citrate lyase subunit gamma (acyl carrier protein)
MGVVIRRSAIAGTLESNDILVNVSPSNNDDLAVEVKSIVKELYGEHIESVARNILKEMGVSSGKVSLQDRGALDYAIRARIEAAVSRAGRDCN